MHTLSNGKIRRSKAEWEELICRWEAGGKSITEFCREESLAESSFSKWRNRLRNASTGIESKFVNLSASPSKKESEVEIRCPSGVIICLRGC